MRTIGKVYRANNEMWNRRCGHVMGENETARDTRQEMQRQEDDKTEGNTKVGGCKRCWNKEFDAMYAYSD